MSDESDSAAVQELEAEVAQLAERAEAAETRAERAEERLESLQDELAAQEEAQQAAETEVLDVGEPGQFGPLRYLVLGAPVCVNGYLIEYDYQEPEEYTAQGQYCEVELQVENTGNAPEVFYPETLLIDSEDRSYAQDEELTWAVASVDDSVFGAELNPGQSGTVTVLFDIPRTVTPSQLQVGLAVGEYIPEDEAPIVFELEDPEWQGEGSVEWQEG